MKRFFVFPLSLLLAVFSVLVAGAAPAGEPLEKVIDEQFAFAAKQYKGMLAEIQGDAIRLPRSADKGRVHLVKAEDWTSGFFPGCLWLTYEQTRDGQLRKAAEDFTGRLVSVQHQTDTHDLGFMLMCSYGEALRVTGEKAYLAPILEGGRTLARRFNPKTGLIKSWDFGQWQFPVIIDNMMNLELLEFTGRQTGDASYLKMAVSHADKTLANHFRADGSCFHLVDYDARTGEVLKRQTVQGYADSSSWARGQGWALYGYTSLYRLTREKRYLEQACRVADFLISHPRMPADGIPYWDYDAPDIPKAPRDASAGALMASALLELSSFCEAGQAARYRAFSELQVRSLCGPAYRATEGGNGHFLIMHCVGHMPQRSEVDVPLCYADYYFLQALGRWKAYLGK